MQITNVHIHDNEVTFATISQMYAIHGAVRGVRAMRAMYVGGVQNKFGSVQMQVKFGTRGGGQEEREYSSAEESSRAGLADLALGQRLLAIEDLQKKICERHCGFEQESI